MICQQLRDEETKTRIVARIHPWTPKIVVGEFVVRRTRKHPGELRGTWHWLPLQSERVSCIWWRPHSGDPNEEDAGWNGDAIEEGVGVEVIQEWL